MALQTKKVNHSIGVAANFWDGWKRTPKWSETCRINDSDGCGLWSNSIPGKTCWLQTQIDYQKWATERERERASGSTFSCQFSRFGLGCWNWMKNLGTSFFFLERSTPSIWAHLEIRKMDDLSHAVQWCEVCFVIDSQNCITVLRAILLAFNGILLGGYFAFWKCFPSLCHSFSFIFFSSKVLQSQLSFTHRKLKGKTPTRCLKSRAKLNSRLGLNGLLGCHIATSGLGQARVEWEKEIAQIESAAGLRKNGPANWCRYSLEKSKGSSSFACRWC